MRMISASAHRALPAAALLTALLGAAASAGATSVDVTLRLDPDNPSGSDPRGRLLLFAPNPTQPGSSISHWDPSANPDLLMEPSASPSLSFAQTDVTPHALQDLGWPPGSSNITLRFTDPPDQGFNDPSLGAQRRAAAQFVAQLWAARLRSGVEINLEVRFRSIPPCDATNGAVLAQAGTNFIFSDFRNAPLANTWYHGSLAESLAGENLSLEDVPGDPDAPDITATFNIDIDDGCLGGGSRWYYGLDGDVPSGQISFVNVAIHEFAHGLGFATLTRLSDGAFFMSMPDIFTRLIFDNDFGRNWHQLNAAQRATSAVNDGRVAWSGARVTNAAPGFLEPAPVLTINAPAALAGNLRVATAEFGPQLTVAGVGGNLVIARDGSADPTLACAPLANPGEVQGNIALIDRGDCLFTEKVINAQNAGAIGVVIVNNVDGPLIQLGRGSDDNRDVRIPAVHISRADGAELKRALTVGLPPAPPSGLTVTPLGGGRVRLSWTDNSDDESNFRVERRRANANFVEIGSVGADVASFEDSGLETGVTYTYRVRSRNPAGSSPYSNQVSITLEERVPEAPAGLEAETRSSTEVLVSWRDRSTDEESFVLEGRAVARRDGAGPLTFLDGPFETVAEPGADETSFLATGLAPGTTYNFRLRARNSSGVSEPSNEATATTAPTAPPAPCAADDETLCLLDDRFAVRVFFRNQFAGGETGIGHAIPGNIESGTFWFFRPDNIELVVKLLDARVINNAHWVFYGALSSVEYWIVVTDTAEGAVNTYYNPPDEVCGQADTRAFVTPAEGVQPAMSQLVAAPPPAAPAETLGVRAAAGETGCLADEETLCLLDGRFAVRVDWTDQRSGDSGTGRTIPSDRGDSTGFFWFFSPTNTELVLKVIDGRELTGHFWVFYGALSDVEYRIEVTDTMTGDSKTYFNPPGNICGVADTQALPGE